MPETHPFAWWKYFRALGPAVAFWLILLGSLAYLLFERTQSARSVDQANMHEWLDEARSFRKSTPELIREYAARLDAANNDPHAEEVRLKAEEITEQLKAMADPLRLYQGQLPLFPEVYSLQVHMQDRPESVKPVVWNSPVPRPRKQNQDMVRPLTHRVRDGDGNVIAHLTCEYRIHAFNKLQRDEQARQRFLYIAGGVVFGGSALAMVWVYLFLQRERRQERSQLEAENAREHAEVLMLEAKIVASEAEHAAKEAEKANLEMKSQLYASIGIMAGSYAHNIKNLLVRPNDLIARCLEADSLQPSQTTMLNEVRGTLATVTDRLQMILRTVRRDPNKTEMTRLDLNDLLRETDQTWSIIAREKWKMVLETIPAPEPAFISGDLSHLQQAVENLVFNARDATFEMRNQVRDAARLVTDPAKRKQSLIDAASWRGQVSLSVRADGDDVVLEVRDNGIGMTEDVRDRCLETHFTTKRDNALYEGYNAGMGLGLSFVAVVLEHHEARLSIESEPLKGTTFFIRFPRRDQPEAQS
ncbi:sensor histidine kinase [Zavarzinella formosa]|uniref:sensor histidine kinase n=1 Tax=Zavarzinella formosa TaxID=360055 RepID=UPI0002FE94DE|nr:HAMP domain-containing sensor histidine kinase [Zavarzinella formosa]